MGKKGKKRLRCYLEIYVFHLHVDGGFTHFGVMVEIPEKKEIQGRMANSLLDILSQEGNAHFLMSLWERRQETLMPRKCLTLVLRPLDFRTQCAFPASLWYSPVR